MVESEKGGWQPENELAEGGGCERGTEGRGAVGEDIVSRSRTVEK